ncbi:MAG: MFS transporter [Chitinophagales bacterium]|nr:MFS transporter [Chitinophagales bacterium]
MSAIKPSLSFWQIVNMNFGFFGIQYSFGLQQTAINPIYSFLHADPEQLPLLNLAGPMTGLLIQPIIGAMSDKTWHPRWGRRKPYFLVGAIFCSLCLFAFPFSSTLWMAAGLLWILDAANNTAMEPYRAFVADKLPESQYGMGFLTQSFFTGLGITLANLSLFFFQGAIVGQSASGIPYWVYGSFFVGAVCSICSVLWSLYTTPEIPPTEQELAYIRDNKHGALQPVIEIWDAIKNMPTAMWQLSLVYLFQWYALFIYWQYCSHSIAQSVWKTNSVDNPALYEEAVGWTGLINGWYNIVTFLSAFGLVLLAKKYGPKKVHFVCLLIAGLGLLAFANIEDKHLLFAPMTGFGIAWASMMGVPYMLVVGSIPKERFGVYMGIINMMIVIPMIIQTLSFGAIYKHLLGSNPGVAIMVAGGMLLVAAAAVLRIQVKQTDEEVRVMGGGH